MRVNNERMVRLTTKRSVTAALALASSLLVGSEAFVSGRANRGVSTNSANKITMCFSKEQDTVVKDEDSFQVQTWNPLRLAVLRLGLTEPMATSPFNYGKYDGEFTCAYCGQTLFDSSAKYDSQSGWPSFWRTAKDGAVQYKRELDGRLECQCSRCSSHLGHVFLDGPQSGSVSEELLQSSPSSDPRGRSGDYLPRFCINGAAMNYNKREE